MCLCVCDLKTATIRRPGAEMGCCATGLKKKPRAKCTRHRFLSYDNSVSIENRTDVREMGCEVGGGLNWLGKHTPSRLYKPVS